MALTNNDMDSIVKILLNPANRAIFKRCNLFDQPAHVNEIDLMKSNYIVRASASLSDVILSDVAKDGETFKLAFKIWFDWESIPVAERARRARDMRDRIGNLEFDRLFGPAPEPPTTTYDMFVAAILDDISSLSLNYEHEAYRFITHYIILRNVSPNFLPLLYGSSIRLFIPDVCHKHKPKTPLS